MKPAYEHIIKAQEIRDILPCIFPSRNCGIFPLTDLSKSFPAVIGALFGAMVGYLI